MAKVSKKNKVITKLKNFINDKNIDGYIFPKNDCYFTEYSKINNLSKITNFTGSAGFALILKDLNYLFVDGRYTLQAKKEAGKKFKILEIPYFFPKDLTNLYNFKIGFNPKLFTENTLEKYFSDYFNLIPIEYNFKNKIEKKSNKIFKLDKLITGESTKSKIIKVRNYMKKNKLDYLFISASENVNWLLNIRGNDLPNSPIINCKLIITIRGKIYLFLSFNKLNKSSKMYLKNIILCEENKFFEILSKLQNGNFCIDKNTCSIFEKKILSSNFKITQTTDPIYDLKSIKNATEIKNIYKAHIEDGVAVTKFIYWFKKNEKAVNERKVEIKLENLRKKSKNYLYPSFDTIAGSGPNGAIIHYKSNKFTNRKLKTNDILLVDSGGQYKWGTTDITRTICKGSISNKIKDNFTRVLKGHIAVVKCDLKKNYNGYLIDKLARKYLKSVGLDYSHGTGHGVGFFMNVHEGPQAISKYNKVRIRKGMVLSNEPGFYMENKYGIRIENLIYADELKKKLIFKNLTFAPIDIDLINFKMLNLQEKRYMFEYHLDIYSKISKFLNKKEKNWLIRLIK